MNYIMTLKEFETLVVLLGGHEVFGMQELAPTLSREDIVEAVARLTRRGVLIPEENRFHCKPEVRTLVQWAISPQRTILITATDGKKPQICGYFVNERCTLLERIPLRKGEYRLRQRDAQELTEELAEDGYLPEDSKTAEEELPDTPRFLHDTQETLIAHGEEKGLRFWVDFFDGQTHRQQARGVVYQQDHRLLFATLTEEKEQVAVYHQKSFSQWLCRTMKGEAI